VLYTYLDGWNERRRARKAERLARLAAAAGTAADWSGTPRSRRSPPP